ncbi:hypothetical protein ACFE04_013582 [Oxalis oulophora]
MADVSMCSSSGATELVPEEERVLIRDIALAAESNCREGDLFYLINQRWWQHWIEYVNQDQPNNANELSSLSEHCDSAGSSTLKRPSGIDNSDLIYDTTSEFSNPGTEIQESLLEGRDYVLLPKEVWNRLHLWYGGGPKLERKVISSGLSQTELAVEVYPLRLQLLLVPKDDRAIVRISKKETIGELYRRACEIFCLNLEQVRIWDYYGRRKHALLNCMERTLDDINIQMDQEILVEVISNVNGISGGSVSHVMNNGHTEKPATSVPIEPSKSSLSIAGGLSASNGFRTRNADYTQNQNSVSVAKELDQVHGTIGVTTRGASVGLTGLVNLGNTCFMNSAIQCLVHTPEFARYFREDYHREINWQNPLGMVGELAMAFGELLRKLWAPGRTPVAPRPFKAKLARFAPQFSGYNQHDSQELLAFLLDGLHEDLNRVKHKPYSKPRDADGRPDEEVADEYWANHIARNDSIIVDVCQGQYKSTLICPLCNKVSVTFDPFMYLSLPLQSTTTRTMTVTVFTSNGSVQPSTCTVTVPKQGRCRDLIQALSNACSLKPDEELKLAEVQNHLIQRFLEEPLISLATIKDDDHLAAYKVPKSGKSIILLKLIHRRQEGENIDAQWKPFGVPLITLLSHDKETTRGNIQTIVHKMLSPSLKKDGLAETHTSDTKLSSTNSGEPCIVRKPCTDSGSASDSMDVDVNSSKGTVSENLPLQLVDEDESCIDLSVEEESIINLPSSSTQIVVYIDWSPKLLENYDIYHLENLPEVLRNGPVAKKARTEPLSLYTCLEAFLREEPLVPEEMWFCPQCKEHRQASKKLDLWRLPEVLVIHLKRFSYSRSTKHKLETFVNFPIHDFDLTNYIANKNNSQRQLYELYALTNHYGGMGSGHYTAYIKLLDENRWYNFDDTHISPINEEEVKSPAAYVLFYRRVKSAASNGNAGQKGGAFLSQ